MGFRSTLAAEDGYIDWPAWFRQKHHRLLLGDQLVTPWEIKTYVGEAVDLPRDIQRVLTELDRSDPFVYVWLHDCGGITRVHVERDRVTVSCPTDWHVIEDTEPTVLQDGIHHYCSGCSDPDRFRTTPARAGDMVTPV